MDLLLRRQRASPLVLRCLVVLISPLYRQQDLARNAYLARETDAHDRNLGSPTCGFAIRSRRLRCPDSLSSTGREANREGLPIILSSVNTRRTCTRRELSSVHRSSWHAELPHNVPSSHLRQDGPLSLLQTVRVLYVLPIYYSRLTFDPKLATSLARGSTQPTSTTTSFPRLEVSSDPRRSFGTRHLLQWRLTAYDRSSSASIRRSARRCTK